MKRLVATSLVIGLLLAGASFAPTGPTATALPPSSILPNTGGIFAAVGEGNLAQSNLSLVAYVPTSASTVNLQMNNFCDIWPTADEDPDNEPATDGDTGRATTIATAFDRNGTVLASFSCTNQNGGGPIDLTSGVFDTISTRDEDSSTNDYNIVNVNVSVDSYDGSGPYINGFALRSDDPGVVIASTPGAVMAFSERNESVWSMQIDFALGCGEPDRALAISLIDTDTFANPPFDYGPYDYTWRLQETANRVDTADGDFVDVPAPFGSGTVTSGDSANDVTSTITYSQTRIYRLILEGVNQGDVMQVQLPPELTQINSRDTCVTSAPVGPRKTPYFEVYDGTVVAGDRVVGRDTNSTIPNALRNLGSRTEHSVIANGVISRFGSSGDYLEDDLIFRNNGGNDGRFNYAEPATPTALRLFNTLTDNSTTPWPATTIDRAGQTVYKFPSATLTSGGLFISQNISLPDYPINDYGDIRSLIVIVEGNIYISGDVTQLNGMFIATGDIISCSDNAGNFTDVLQCGNRLDVRGSFIADGDIYMTRSVGGLVQGGSDEGPAEIIRNAPEMTLVTPELNYTRELPVIISQ